MKENYVPYDKKGDQLEVRLRDESHRKTYENEVRVSNIKKLAALVRNLEHKGVPLKKAQEYIKQKSRQGIEFW